MIPEREFWPYYASLYEIVMELSRHFSEDEIKINFTGAQVTIKKTQIDF